MNKLKTLAAILVTTFAVASCSSTPTSVPSANKPAQYSSPEEICYSITSKSGKFFPGGKVEHAGPGMELVSILNTNTQTTYSGALMVKSHCTMPFKGKYHCRSNTNNSTDIINLNTKRWVTVPKSGLDNRIEYLNPSFTRTTCPNT